MSTSLNSARRQPFSYALLLLALGVFACGPVDDRKKTDKEDDEQEQLVDQCQSEEDLEWLGSQVNDEQTGRQFARDAASDCGLGCLTGKPTPDACALECMIDVRGVKISESCSSCYGGIVLCTINKCLPQCIDDPQAEQCKDCQEAKGCQGAFDTCAGELPGDDE